MRMEEAKMEGGPSCERMKISPHKARPFLQERGDGPDYTLPKRNSHSEIGPFVCPSSDRRERPLPVRETGTYRALRKNERRSRALGGSVM
ncbi:hypothetical protein SKAU_G00071460 [Synaphobranchus kaupii]|uniref:Uncharacterized protein n=1 Tax=Synaphobranchus kaupii TaxID=118154 RepID=A0A9Q1G7S6_SYNKA|nr:hypothetical protein SKAU_G00071460 [Synaphobranchus kaupii]